jgi:hypothetical protein
MTPMVAAAAMPGRGGAAAIYGFLYQLLATSARLVEAIIVKAAAGEAPDTVTAILEPSPGGDLELLAAGRSCIQFKHRSAPLGSGELIDAVLADLFAAHCAEPCDRYELQCSRRLTRPAQRLVERLRGSLDQHPDTETQLSRLRSRCQQIFEARCHRPTEGFNAEFSGFALRFTVGPQIESEQARLFLEAWLRTRLPYVDRIEAALDQLIGNLLARSAANDAALSGSDFLAVLNLTGTPVSPGEPLRRLHERLAAALRARRFELCHDVRPVLLPSPAEPVTLVSGSSGCGKTWALCRIAHDLDARGETALLLSAPTLAMLHEQLRRAVAIEALNHESPIAPSALGRLWRRSLAQPDAELWVLWEGCRDVDELASLQLQNGLGTGMRLVAELPAGAAVTDTPLASAPTQIVGEFSESELFDALGRRSIPAGRVPKPIRRMLRLPVLCGIYASLAAELSDWNPTNEYLVLARFWERAQQRVGPLAGAQLKRLARRMLERRRSRLSDEDLAELGLAEPALVAFIDAGWLARLDQSWAFAHERLLTWSVAEALCDRFFDDAIEPAALAETIRELGRAHEHKARLQKLGFLLMDVLWLVMRRGAAEARVAELMAALEADPETGRAALYRELLPTAGAIIVPFLKARLRIAPQSLSPAGLSGDVAAALLALPEAEVDRAAIAAGLAAIDAPIARTALLLVGQRWPLQAQRDTLWAELLEISRAHRGGDFDFERFQYLEGALLRVTTDAPDWLHRKIDQLDDPEELSQAVNLLNKLPHAQAQPIWTSTAVTLVTELAGLRPALLIESIGRFGDHNGLALLRQSIERGDGEADSAMAALAAIDPDEALSLIARHPPVGRLPVGRLWLDRLLDAQPAQAPELIRSWLLQRDPTGRSLASLWQKALERIDGATLTAMLKLLDRHSREVWRDGRAADALFDLLGHLELGPEHDELFAFWRETPLAGRILERARSHISGDHDDHYVSVRRLLRRIGGSHYAALVHSMLDRPLGLCLTGIRSSLFAPTPEVTARLESLADDWDAECEDEVRIELWRALWAIDPERWYPRVIALLAAKQPARIHLGIFLLREGGLDDMLPALLACVERSEPGSRTEALAMGLAIQISDGAPILFERGRARFLRAEDDENGRVAAFNVLLKDRSPEGRTLLDTHLLGITSASSFKSYDLDLLAIRLGQDDVSDALLKAGERFMRRPTFFGESIIDAYIERSPAAAKNALLERAFAVPDIFTNGQPDAIRALAEIDPTLAEQAFVQSWRDHPERRRYLAPAARALGDGALQAMIEHLAEDLPPNGSRPVFRNLCVELRRRHTVAHPMLLEALAAAPVGERIALCEALGWMPDHHSTLAEVETGDPDPEVRERAYSVRRMWERHAWAIQNFRAHPLSLEAMEYLVDTVDPAILCNWDDPWCIIPIIQQDSRLMMFAEAQFARRYNEVSDSKLKRVRLRPRVLQH